VLARAEGDSRIPGAGDGDPGSRWKSRVRSRKMALAAPTHDNQGRTSMSTHNNRLVNFPVSFFSSVMGLAGLTIAWQRAERLFGVNVSDWLLALTIGVFLVLVGFYAAKWLRHPQAVVKEFQHPVRLNFFPTLSISLLLLSVALLPHSTALSLYLWVGGTALHLLFTLVVMSIWIHHTKFEITHINPAWFIPVVGNIIVPIAGTAHGYYEISWFFFSIGLVFWVVLLTLVFYRLVFHPPLPQRLVPTLFILIAPPAVGFLSYSELVSGVDPFARVLYYSALFLTLLLATQVRLFARLKFALSWWAYSFPLAAVTLATLRMHRMSGAEGLANIGHLLLAALTLVLAGLAVLTVRAILRREICVEEG
jgi:tellurite resistance protein